MDFTQAHLCGRARLSTTRFFDQVDETKGFHRHDRTIVQDHSLGLREGETAWRVRREPMRRQSTLCGSFSLFSSLVMLFFLWSQWPMSLLTSSS